MYHHYVRRLSFLKKFVSILYEPLYIIWVGIWKNTKEIKGMVKSVLVIDDDPKIQTVIGHYLEDDGYKVLLAGSGQEAMSVIESASHLDVILLDLGLPDMDGLTLMNRIRAQVNVPIIVVSGKDDATDKVVGLEMGADDYIGKPFHLRELSARIKSVLRRSLQDNNNNDNKPDEKRTIEFEGWVMDAGKFELKAPDGSTVNLTTGEFKLLNALVSSANRVLSREQLFDLTREDSYDSYDRAVDIQIGRLRKKLDDDPKAPRFIKTIRGVGYMFIGTISKTI